MSLWKRRRIEMERRGDMANAMLSYFALIIGAAAALHAAARLGLLT